MIKAPTGRYFFAGSDGMLQQIGDIIKLTRGDTAHFVIAIKNADGTDYVPEADDLIAFTVRKRDGGAKLIEKTVLDTGECQIDLDPADTSSLLCGKYQYDVQVTQASSGDVSTIIGPALFELLGEVT